MDDSLPAALMEAAATLPTIYADPAHYDILAQMTAPDDIGFYRMLCEEHADGPVLELGCGTGRVLLALAREGRECVGVELSPAMLDYARQKAELEELGVTLALGDLRGFDLERTFSLVLLTYNTLNHMLDEGSLIRALRSAKKHMDARSRLVIDTFQPSLAFLASPPERRPILRYRDPYTQDEVRIFEDNRYETATQVNHVTWSYEVAGEPDKRVEELPMRIFFPAELDAILALAGLELDSKHGDYDGRPFASDSPKQLCVCRLAG